MELWHGIRKSPVNADQTNQTMKPNAERARKLMDAATRMMLVGDVERYMHALRLLFALRKRSGALA